MALNGPQETGINTGWQDFYNDRVQRRDLAQDEALRAHFQAELDLAKITMDAMGIKYASGGTEDPGGKTEYPGGKTEYPGSETEYPGSETEYPGSETEYPGSETEDPGSETEDPGGKPGATTLGPGLHDNLKPYSQAILNAAEATGVPANLIAAVIWDESKGQVSAGSVNGGNGQTDSGLMQINPDTFASLKAKYPNLLPNGNVNDPQTNIMAGALYLKEQYKTFGSWDLALRAYNSGPGSVDRSDPSASTTGLGTKNYVEKINYFMDIIEKGGELPLSGYPGGNGTF